MKIFIFFALAPLFLFSFNGQTQTSVNLSAENLLIEISDSNGAGFVYIWSPQMPLSVDGLSLLSEKAIELGVKPIFVLEPNLPENKIEEAENLFSKHVGKKAALYIYDTNLLDAFDPLSQFPTTIFFKNYNLSFPSIPGFIFPDDLELLLTSIK